MKTEPPPRHHHEGEPPPESLIHHAEPTLLEQWLRRGLAQGVGFWAGVAVVLGGVIAAGVIAWRVGGPSRAGMAAWTELAAIGAAPSALSPFGPDPNAGLPERLREVAREYPGTEAARWAELRAATLLLNEGSAELATTRRSAGAGKVVEADDLFRELLDSARDESLKRMAALGLARSAEARLGLDADDPDHARLDDVLALYDKVVADYPETPEAEQAASLRRRLRRADSIAFYEQLARYDPAGSFPGSSSLPGMDLAPGASAPLQGLFDDLPPLGGGFPSGLGSGTGLDLGPPGDLSGPDDPVGMPAPVAIPGARPPAEPDPEAPDPEVGADEPAPASATAEPEADSPAQAPESPRVPDDPFGNAPAIPVDPAPAPSPAPSPGGTLPDDVFPSGGPNG